LNYDDKDSQGGDVSPLFHYRLSTTEARKHGELLSMMMRETPDPGDAPAFPDVIISRNDISPTSLQFFARTGS